ncbi:MAG: NAD(+) kinase [Pseudomonadota bacterium]|nr:NAD(+) kinase [Pseudomonadota bacterium]
MADEKPAQHSTKQPEELKKFQRVAVVARHHTDSILDSVLKVEAVLLAAGIDVVIDAETADVLPSGAHKVAPKSDLETMDLVVVVGGDGSLLGYGRDLAASGVPVVGVNRGGLGFLAAVSPDQIDTSFAEILAGDYAIEDHFLLQATVTRKGQTIALQTALNDVVVNPGSPARMMEFALWVDGEYVYDQRSDGLIIASPTGSTAYSLSAGGPIMHPGLDAIVIVPMFPHTLTSRPLVVPGEKVLRLRLLDVVDAEPQMSCDSQVHVELQIGDEVVIEKYAAPLRLLYPPGHSFYQSCRSKLDWGSRLGGQRT